MKMIASLFVMICLALSGPSFCAHASNGPAMDVPVKQITGHADHAIMEQDMAKASHHMPADHSNHCPDSCDGGEDCQGCSAVTTAIFSNAADTMSITPEIIQAINVTTTIEASTPLDPPPPKYLF